MTYKIWKPEHDGHTPPNWREGMLWVCYFSEQLDPHPIQQGKEPSWESEYVYYVPTEALNSPNDDAEHRMRDYAIKTLLQEGEDALNGLVRELRQYPAEELAEHGITLAPEKDWATELWADALNESGRIVAANDVRKGIFDDNDRAAIELLRTRFEQMKGER